MYKLLTRPCKCREKMWEFAMKWHEKAPKIGVWGFVNRIGFEPMTYCLEGSCSIQLSYEVFPYRRCKNTTNFWEFIHLGNICVSHHIYDKFHRKEKINSFFLLILRQTKFFGGLVLLIASNL